MEEQLEWDKEMDEQPQYNDDKKNILITRLNYRLYRPRLQLQVAWLVLTYVYFVQQVSIVLKTINWVVPQQHC